MSAKSKGARPDFCFRRVTQIQPQWLLELGVQGLLLDIDNTITRWEKVEVGPEYLEWLQALQAAGLQVVLLSNGLGHKKAAVTKQTGLPLVSGLLVKPFPAAFRQGLRDMGVEPQRAVMIGDSVLTDICGANRAGMWTILVEPLSSVDFLGTKIYRFLETILRLRRPLFPENDFRQQP